MEGIASPKMAVVRMGTITICWEVPSHVSFCDAGCCFQMDPLCRFKGDASQAVLDTSFSNKEKEGGGDEEIHQRGTMR